MIEENRNTSNFRKNKTLIIAVAVAVLAIIFMYFHDQKQQRAYDLRCLERRVELLEEWGRQRSSPPPSAVVTALIAKSYVHNDNWGRCFNC